MIGILGSIWTHTFLHLDLNIPIMILSWLGFAISRFFPEPGNREMGGPEPVYPGFGFRFCMSYS